MKIQFLIYPFVSALFSDEGMAAKPERGRKSSAFLEVPSVNDRTRSSFIENKAPKRRRGKRNSVDVSVIGSSTKIIRQTKNSLVSLGKSEQKIKETSDPKGDTLPALLAQSPRTPPSSALTSSCPTSPLEQNLETKPRGLSVSSIVYAVDNLLVQRNVLPLSSVEFDNEESDEYIDVIRINDYEKDDEEVLST